jgi:hypothetical protein
MLVIVLIVVALVAFALLALELPNEPSAPDTGRSPHRARWQRRSHRGAE